jgi:putative DNA methylase
VAGFPLETIEITMTYRKKLIEVSLPLEAINREAAREKSIRHGHPSTLHLWWARRPLAACRAVLFASLVDDPSEYMPDEESARVERERLFRIIEDLVKWENSNNEEVLDKAKLEIARSVARTLNVDPPVGREAVREFLATKAPPVLDPFAGGGSIPLEAQRLGLRAYASDLNPVAVLINKALIEIPPKFANMPPVHPPEESPSPLGEGSGVRSKKKKTAQPELWQREWKGAQGLAEDVRYYGKWMRDEAFKRIGHLYPPVTITEEILAERPDLREQGLKPGDQLTVIAWLWARTVKCPNPACGAQMPLATSFVLSSKKGRQAWVVPVVDHARKQIGFTVRAGEGSPPPPPKIGRGAQFRCLVCGQIAPEDDIRAEFKAKRNGAQLMAIVAEGRNGRVYLPPHEEHVRIAQSARPAWIPEDEMNTETPNLVSGRGYGITHWHELFTPRQLTALATFSGLVGEARQKALEDARAAGGRAPQAYADAVTTYLAFAVDKGANYWSSFCAWHSSRDIIVSTFARQALPMVWDYAEANPLSDSSGNFLLGVEQASEMLENVPAIGEATVRQANAMENTFGQGIIISTDPPYYDNICYADLSDFFYVWLRYSLKSVYPSLFATMTVPKTAELVATPYRFDGDKRKAEEFFETGLRQTFKNFRYIEHPVYPTTVFYAFKQTETDDEIETNELLFDTRASTGWETMLAGLIESGFQITGTLPMRTELVTSLKKTINALATSVVLVCRPRPENASTITRREFLSALKKELAPALRELQQGSIAPVDLAQAAIGPGMAVFSRYSAVLEADGSPMSVRTALGLINQALDEYLTEQEGEYDSDTRWALAWFEQFGHNEAPYGVAETLSKAKNTSVNGLVEAGILEARAGKVRLYRRDELLPSPGRRGAGGEVWDPNTDKRPTAWEAVQRLIHALENQGEAPAAELLTKLGGIADPARDLAYRLYTVCERKGWAQDALGYNMLVAAWPRLKELASRQKTEQGKLL